jgi:hypothetical protein
MDRTDATPPATADAAESAPAAVKPAKAPSSRARGTRGRSAAAGRARKQAAKPARRSVGQAAVDKKAAPPTQPEGKPNGKVNGKTTGKAKSEAKSGAPRAAKAPASPAKPRAAKSKPPAKAESSDKSERVKLVRDSFTMPKADVDLIGLLKQRALKLGREVKKSELLRAGLHALAAFDDAAFTAAVAAVPRLKTGRPHQKKNR